MINIRGNIIGINYKVLLSEELTTIDIKNYNINESPAYCIVTDHNHSFGISKWVSPKRTRSYPYERVYNTLNVSNKITIIPLVKDEGYRGDRDFIQWDTISLMSLLDIFVIFAFYCKAEISLRNKWKITNQQFDHLYVISKIKEIQQYHSSALHWNLNELKNKINPLIDKIKTYYFDIENDLGVKMHSSYGLDFFKQKIGGNVESFIRFSREKSEKAQSREVATIQPKEKVSTNTKGRITITNYLGGEYFFTVDETYFDQGTIDLIETKHSFHSILPSRGDIKNGLLKMILYSNLSNVEVDGIKMKSRSILKLTSSKLRGKITSNVRREKKETFYFDNHFSKERIQFINTLFKEATENHFIVKICHSE